MEEYFEAKEKLYRAVFPPEMVPMFWKENGQISSAVFKDKNGLSVERAGNRQEKRILEYMHRLFTGLIISVNYQNCNDCGAYAIYLPSKRSNYHSEIHGSRERIVLSPSQCKYLARLAMICG